MGRFLEKLMAAPEVKPLFSDEYFSVDGTLLQAWASHASLERIDGEEDLPPPPSGPGLGFGQLKEGKKRARGDFRGIKLSTKTHRSGSDPDALLARKSNAHRALPSYRGHMRMDIRHALIVDCRVTQAVGWSAPVQAARHRQGECGVWPARNRRQPDPAGQPAQAGNGGGMNRRLPRGMADGSDQAASSTGAKRLKSGVLNG